MVNENRAMFNAESQSKSWLVNESKAAHKLT